MESPFLRLRHRKLYASHSPREERFFRRNAPPTFVVTGYFDTKKSDLRKVAFFIVALTAAARLQVAKCAVSLADDGHCRLILNKDRV